MKMTFEYDKLSITMTTDGETPEDAVDLASRLISWRFDEVVELAIVNKEDDTIYIETNVPRDNIQHEGM